LSAVGLRPRTALAATAGLATGRGIRVDRQLRTSAEHIYALGDCAEVDGLNLLYVMPLMACARALAKTLAGEPGEVRYGPMPVMVKTPACPLVVAVPPPGRSGTWEVSGEGRDWQALCHDAAGKLLGYGPSGSGEVGAEGRGWPALCHDAAGNLLGCGLRGPAVQGRLALNRQLSPLLD